MNIDDIESKQKDTEVREIVPWGTFGASEFVNSYGLCVMKKKKPRTPEYDKPREGCAKIDPKVNEPFEPIPRRMTRKELLKRIRELFSNSKIEELLKRYDVDFSKGIGKSTLDLNMFDDKIYDIYPNEYWLNKAKDPKTSRQLKLQAECLFYDKPTRTGTWKRVLINSYDRETETFGGIIDDKEKQQFSNIPKLFIHFDAESPFVVAKRISEAIKLREKSESRLRYMYYLSKIPKYETFTLPREKLEKIVEQAKLVKGYEIVEQKLESEINELNNSYILALNKLMFDELYFTQKSTELCSITLKIDPEPVLPVPYYAKEMLYNDNPNFNFAELQKAFEVKYLPCKRQIIEALAEIKKRNNRMINQMSLYYYQITNTMKVDEFKKEQNRSFTEFKKRVEHEEIGEIKKILERIKSKGNDDANANANANPSNSNFEIDFINSRPEKNKKYYFIEDMKKEKYKEILMSKINEFKTRNLINMINMMMRDSLYFLVVKSIISFVEFFERNIPIECEIVNTNTVKNVYQREGKNKIRNIAQIRLELSEDCAFNMKTDSPDDDLNTTYDIIEDNPERSLLDVRVPIFHISLKYKEGNFDYHYKVEDLVTELKKIFDQGIDKIQKIPVISFSDNTSLLHVKYYDILHREKQPGKTPTNLTTPTNPDPANPNTNTLTIPPREEVLFAGELYERFGNSLMYGKEPLQKFLDSFNIYKEDLDIVPESFVKTLDEQGFELGNSVQLLRDDIIKRQKLYDKILNEISEEVHVSYFLVNCKEIRDNLLNKYDKIREIELTYLSKKSQEIKTSVFNQIEEIRKGINKANKNIDELVEIEKYIEDVPALLENIKVEISTCESIYKIMDEFQQKVQYIDLRMRYKLIEAPTDIINTISTAKALLNKQRERFLDELLDSQTKLKEEMQSLEKNMKILMAYNSMNYLQEAAQLARALEATFKDCQEKARLYNTREVHFSREQTDYGHLNEMYKEFEPFFLIWTYIDTFENKSEEYRVTPISKLNGKQVQEMNDAVYKYLNISIKKLKERDQILFARIIETAEEIKMKSENFRPVADLAVSLTTQGMEERHWIQLKEATKIDFLNSENQLTLKSIENSITIDISVMSKAREIADKASREYNIEQKLAILERNWKDVKFLLQNYRNPGINIIGGFGDIYKVLDEDVQEVQQLEVSPFKGPFLDDIINWSKSLLNITDILEALNKFQSKWIQLQPIFESPDISKSIPRDAKNFSLADKAFKEIVKGMKENLNVKVVCSKDSLIKTINEENARLEDVEKGLNDYIERKKLLFPRFYFLSNENLLKILSETKDLKRVKENLKNIFEKIHNIELRDEKYITKMISNYNEVVPLKETICIERKNIEKWMYELQEVMFSTVKACMLRAINTYLKTPRKQWIFEHSGQSVIHANQTHWTNQVEEALEKNTVKEYCKEIQGRIDLLVNLLKEPLLVYQAITISNLLTLEVHNKAVTDTFLNGEYNIFSFEWKKQLRYYWDYDKNDMYVKSIQTSFPYGYEYIGNTEILVITPLTDKCYLTLMGAIKFNRGGAPAGPAGTGKTESTKDLAKAIAKQCVVYNCSEDTDFLVVAAFFKGLACCGAWICFDEFNRINIEVLSVIAQQLILLFTAKANGETEITFERSQIRILPTFCVFITMNPDYEGRTALPDNLTALFRPMAMMVPDYKLIAEVYLYSSGYHSANDLSKKIVSTFKLCSEQLSSQFHYDFGMRAVKSVLYAAKKLKSTFSETPEDKLLLRALQDVNIPKFLKEDIPLFNNIIKDLFPKTERPKSDLDDLVAQIKVNCEKMHLQPAESFIAKILQLYDTIQVRHGLMIVGPTGGGKTSNWKVLMKSLTDLNDGVKYFTTKTYTVNPKSIRKPELYCEKDPQNPTEWINGVIPNHVHELNKDTTGTVKYWLLFDGPVDTLWIEDMNSVLDDSKKLCLPSSAIIVLNETITMMFEVEDLTHASPATVSRCGMVFMEPSALGLMPFAESWLNSKLPPTIQNSPQIKGRLKELLTMSLDENVRFVRKRLKEPCPTTDVNLTFSFLKLLECFLERFREKENQKVTSLDLEILQKNIQYIYFFAVIWSIGITSKEDGRAKFDTYLRNFMTDKLPSDSVFIPSEGSVYDYIFDSDKDEWIPWSTWGRNVLEFSTINVREEYTDIIIHTIDSVRYSYMIKILLQNSKHLITTGPTGTGKTVNMINVISKDIGDKFLPLVINFSAQTTASQTQLTIDRQLKKKTRGKYAPDNNKTMIVFVDDLNMPKKEQYEAQPPIEILRQWLDYEGWYDIKEKEKPFMQVVNLIFTGAMGPPGGGRSFLSNRFMRHFNLITYTELTDTSINSIFIKKVTYFLGRFDESIKSLLPQIVEATLVLYKQIKEKLLPIPKSSHYLFNLRDMSKVLQGLCSASYKHTKKKIDIVRLWMHEMIRSFGDRLICDDDRNWLKKIIEQKALSTKDFEVQSIDEIYNGVDKIIFCDFIAGSERPYIQVTNVKDFIFKIEDKLCEYNEFFKNKSMPLVMFLDACDHVARISRIIRQTQGNALLLGVGGSGRQSLARLSSYINYSTDCTQIEVTKGYRVSEFRKNVKEFLKEAGIKKKPSCFLICDTQIFDEQMLEDLNNCLNSGDIPDLYKTEDFEEIRAAVKIDCATKGLPETPLNVFRMYLARVKANIHIIIAMSPVGDLFVTRLRMFPSLVNCCTIDWFTEWPEEALLSVAKDILEKNAVLDLGKSFNGSVHTIKYIHKSVEVISKQFLLELRRYNYLTPTSFLEFLSLFQSIIALKRGQNDRDIKRLETGLKVLQFAEEKISEIEKTIQKQQPELEFFSQQVEKTIVEVEAKKKEAEIERLTATEERKVAEGLAREINDLDAVCQAELTKAEKELEISLKKIDDIKDPQMRELASYQAYSGKLAQTIELLLIFRYGNEFRYHKNNLTEPTGDIKNPFRLSFKQAAVNDLDVTDPVKFKEYFYDFKKPAVRDNLKDNEMYKVNMAKEYIINNRIDRKFAMASSEAMVPCFEFIVGMIDFCEKSINIVDPKKREAAIAREKKVEADAKLKVAEDKLALAEFEANQQEKIYNDFLKQKNNLSLQISENQTKLERAKKLVSLLSSEKMRWGESVEKLKDYSAYIIGDCLIAAAMIAYSGAFTSTYRSKLEESWRHKLEEENILRSPNVSLRSVMEDKLKTRHWNLCQLPNDNLSIENGIIIFRTSKWPLMIDPQNQASIFLKKFGITERETAFQCVKMSDPKMLDHVISAIKFGSWILLDNVGLTLENTLEPILLRQQTKSKSGNFSEIKIGDKIMQYNEEFKLFMITTMSNPHYSPETFAKITIVNFAITQLGLEDQMLSELVKIEMPELEENKNKILEENFKSQESLKKIEDQILDSLSKNRDNIEETLKTSDLIDILTEAKVKSVDINEKIIEGEKTGKQIDEKRDIYRPSAKRSSILFFSILDLSTIDPMYQFSLTQFKRLFENTVRRLHPSDDTNQRILDINRSFSKDLYDFTSRSLFEKDKGLYSFILCVKILMGEQENDEKINPRELRFFLAGPSSDVEVTYPKNPTTCVSSNDWKSFYAQIYGMSLLNKNFEDLEKFFMSNPKAFDKYFESNKNEDTPLPEPYESRLTEFQKLLLIKALRFDKLTNCLTFFVEKNIGKEFTEPPTFNLLKSFSDSTNSVPLLFVLSTGSDPKNDFQQLADQLGKRVDYVSLGKSMDKYAINRIEETKLKGGWILLQNCHLAISFMPKLEDEIEKLQNNPNLDNSFRLWLTSMSSPQFSINALKSSIKITMEPPKGLKLNLQRQYDNIREEELEGCSKPELFKSFFFALCFFHAIVQDRRKFGPIGWNVKYDFTNEDLRVSRLQLKNFLEEYEEVPYKVLNYLVAEINYGGRVTDDKDQRLIQTILLSYLNPNTLDYESNKFSSSGIYSCPVPGSKSDYQSYIKGLPPLTYPEVFGLHDNAEIITAQNEARVLLETFLSMQPRTTTGSGKSSDQVVSEILLIIQQNTPTPFDYEAVFAEFPTEYSESMNTVLIQEVIRYNVLLKIMKKNMKSLKKALQGKIVMNDELDKIVTSLYNNQVPQVWIKYGFLSLKPLMSWIEDLNSRIHFFSDWYENGTPKAFCLSRFSFPQAFLTGTLQNYARKHGKEIDLLSFEFIIMDLVSPERVSERPEDGCYIYGMYLEGAKWNYSTHKLDHSNNRELYTEVPLMHLIPVPNREPPKTGIYNCPMYKVLSRQGTLSTTGHSTNFVLFVELPSKEDESVWIKAGVAMFLALKQ